MRSPLRRWASRGARSTSERRSCSARATAISSSTLPPEYISATTAPASGWPSASAALIDTSAIASTPNRPARKSRTIETASPATTGAVASVQNEIGKIGPAGGVRRRCPPPARRRRSQTSAHRRTRSNGIDLFPARDGFAAVVAENAPAPGLSEINRAGRRIAANVQAGMKRNQAVLPASMVSTLPVMLRPPSPSRYSTMRATSSDFGQPAQRAAAGDALALHLPTGPASVRYR